MSCLLKISDSQESDRAPWSVAWEFGAIRWIRNLGTHLVSWELNNFKIIHFTRLLRVSLKANTCSNTTCFSKKTVIKATHNPKHKQNKHIVFIDIVFPG